MVIIKDLFEESIAKLELKDNLIVLTFLKMFSIGRGKNYKKGESLIYEIFSSKDLTEFKIKTGIRKLPCELNGELFQKVFYFMGGM